MATRIGALDSNLDGAGPTVFGIPDGLAAESIRKSSCTLIQTTNNSYLFLMTGPTEQRGLLVGGALGDSPTPAILVGATPCARNVAEYPSCLRRGSRVIFAVERGGTWKRMITSQSFTWYIRMSSRTRQGRAGTNGEPRRPL